MLPASLELVRCDVYEPGIESPIVEPSWAHLKVRTGASVAHSIYNGRSFLMLGRVKVHRCDRCPRLNGYKSFRNRGPIRRPRTLGSTAEDYRTSRQNTVAEDKPEASKAYFYTPHYFTDTYWHIGTVGMLW